MKFISAERKEEIVKEISERLKNDDSILVGSFRKYNVSNVNHIRSLHIIKDNETMSVYCRKTEVVRGYVMPMNDRRQYLSTSICERCKNIFFRELYQNAIQDELKRIRSDKSSS